MPLDLQPCIYHHWQGQWLPIKPHLLLWCLGLWPSIIAEFCFSLLGLFSGSLIPRGLSHLPACSAGGLFCLLGSGFSCPLLHCPFLASWVVSSLCALLAAHVVSAWTFTWAWFFQSHPLPEPLSQSPRSLNVYSIFIIYSSGTFRKAKYRKNPLLSTRGSQKVESEDV